MDFKDGLIGYGKYSFTFTEIRDLVISAIVLGFIFSFRNWSFDNLLLSIAIVGPALILHELAHKFMAQRYNLLAAYVIWPTGIILSLLITIMTNGAVLFAALGAVMISSVYHTRVGYRFIGLTGEEMGKISWVGPMTNIGLAILCYILHPLNPVVFSQAAFINLIIAIFNCLPFPPLDGVKIFRWNIPMWLGTLIAAVVLMFLPPIIGIVYSLVITIIIVVILFIWLQTVIPVTQQTKSEYA
jgi:Zn-dependent protease